MDSIETQAEFLFYSGPDGRTQIEVLYGGETVWLTQAKMGELFGVETHTINYHLKEIFKSDELEENSVIRKIRTTAADNKSYLTSFYNLDAIISVGYRVNSLQATQFRKWATETLRDYLIKGFAMDDERLSSGTHFGKDYFDELLERIREIRLSERRLHLKITDIFQTSSDYDSNSEKTKTFFAFVQNKLHWAITGQTAAEIIHDRSDATKSHMGLTSWKQSPHGKLLPSDTEIAKNYLSQKELSSLRRIVSAFIDLAEDRAQRKILMRMADWSTFIDQYLTLNSYGILEGSGKVSHAAAVKKAAKEFGVYRKFQDQLFVSDFEKQSQQLLKGKRKK